MEDDFVSALHGSGRPRLVECARSSMQVARLVGTCKGARRKLQTLFLHFKRRMELFVLYRPASLLTRRKGIPEVQGYSIMHIDLKVKPGVLNIVTLQM